MVKIIDSPSAGVRGEGGLTIIDNNTVKVEILDKEQKKHKFTLTYEQGVNRVSIGDWPLQNVDDVFIQMTPELDDILYIRPRNGTFYVQFDHFGAEPGELPTIRYYERRGLLPEPPRNKSGHLQYSKEAVKRTDFIKRCQNLGFSLKEVTEILELRVTSMSTCTDMKTRVDEKLTDVDKRIRELAHIRDALSRLLKKCTGKGPIGSCPILEELYQ